MPGGHGKSTRLNVRGVDLNALDAALDGKGAADLPVRLGIGNAFLGPGRFGRMFDLPKFRPEDDEGLIELARAMTDIPQDPSGDTDIPAGTTYLGQFIDHDITRDKTDGFPEIEDAATIGQARSPSLDLDSLYGLGPAMQPELYDPAFPAERARFVIGRTSDVPSPLGQRLPNAETSLPHDLPREDNRSAIIGDSRNDENLAIAQTHVAFLKFHNAVMDRMPGPTQPPPKDGYQAYCYSRPEGGQTLFHEAQRLVRYHYQWIVLHEFLESIVDASVLQDVLQNGRSFYMFPDGEPFMPVEFSVGAYRFGHSMIREVYEWNRTFNSGGPPALTRATFGLLFAFTGGGGFPAPGPPHSKLPSNWAIDWRRFFDFGRPDLLNQTRKMDTRISPKMHDLAVPSAVSGGPLSLPERNLLRGSRVGLPSGQDVAEAIGANALTPAELSSGAQGAVVQRLGFDETTPLWYYVLKESEVGGGHRLGPVGSRILAEVFVGLLEGSPHSYLSEDPTWTPTLGTSPGTFTMSDLILMAGESSVNVLG